MKIVLVARNASYSHTNLAVRIFKRLLEPRHTVRIVETTVNDRGGVPALVERLYAEKAELYAFSVYIWNRNDQLSAARLIKELFPACAVVLGGPEVSYEEKDFLTKNPFVDFLIRGEGEDALCAVADGKYPRKSIIDGGVYEGFAASPEPYFEKDADAEKELAAGKLVYYESARGCPFRCAYCLSSVKDGKGGASVRCKPAALVKRELVPLLHSGAKAVKFVDRTFNFDRARAKELFAFLIDAAKDRMRNGCYTGPTCHFEICASLLDDETMLLLRKAPHGLFRFEIGVQSVHPETLRAVDRVDDTEQVLAALHTLRETTAVTLHADLICGLPYDTFETVWQGFDALYGSCDMLQMGFLKLLPGTKLRRESARYGMIALREPPYTVLCTDTLPFEKMRRLTRIADASERLSEETFRYALPFLTAHAPGASPFAFFDLAAASGAADQALTARAAFEALASLGRTSLSLSETENEELRERLRCDFLRTNQGPVPRGLLREKMPAEAAFLDAARRRFLRMPAAEAAEEADAFFAPATEAHLFSFEPESVFFIDRKNHRIRRLPLVQFTQQSKE